MKTRKPLVSVIIVNYNGKHLLKEAIDSVMASINKSKIAADIILVDNCSNDGSQDLIIRNYRDVKLVKNETNMGYSGINNALPYCNGSYIFFLNNDIVLDSNCIKNLLEVIEADRDIFQVCPCFVNYYDKNLKSGGTWVSRAFYSGHIKGNDTSAIKEIPYLGMGMVRKEAVASFGYLFDPDYFIYAEDLDLGLRIRLLGKKAVFVPNAIIYHMHSATMSVVESAKKVFLLEKNLMITFFKIMSILNILRLLPYIIFIRVIVISKDMLHGKFGAASARLKALFWIFCHFRTILKKRNETQSLKKAGDSFILKIFTEKYLLSKRFLV